MDVRRNGIDVSIAATLVGAFLSCRLLAGDLPVPEFFGIYAVVADSLVELERNPQGVLMPGVEIGGAALIHQVSSVELPSGDVQFIIFAEGAASHMKIPVVRIARVEKEVTRSSWTAGKGQINKIEDLTDLWYVTDKGIFLRVAPIKDQPTSMVRAVPNLPLSAGTWTLLFNDGLYDFRVGPDSEAATDCLIREVYFAGVAFRDCLTDREATQTSIPQGPSNPIEPESRPEEEQKPKQERYRLSVFSEGGIVRWKGVLHKSPDSSSKTLAMIPEGSEIEVLGMQSGYLQVVFGKKTGWIMEMYVVPKSKE